MMKPSCLVAIAALLAAPLLTSSSARADIPPPDACDTPGSSCNNAGPAYDEPGTCTQQKCQRTLPGEDGGVVTMEYDCNLCISSGGSSTSTSGGSSTSASGGSSTSASGGDSTSVSGGDSTSASSAGADKASSDDGGCAMSGAASGGAMAGLMLLCGAAALVTARRRR
ncbi:hypothetical protein WME79_06560 [Sorangium sp. So ce726]|uniref:hypothetical protein n=1 Tax=Sorangium sp. So ce726 TaxID=3133319 RepID=UPI003F5D6140